MTKKKVGAKYEVIGNGGVHHKFKLGDKLVLVRDDGTHSPRFKRQSDGEEQWVIMKDVKRIKKSRVGDKFIVVSNSKVPKHYFDIGTEVVMIADYGNGKGEFKRASGITQTINMKDVKRVKTSKRVKAGDKAIVIGTRLTHSRHRHTPSMAQIGQEVEVVSVRGDKVSASKNGECSFVYAIEDLKPIKEKKKPKQEEAKEFELGDIVEIISKGSSANEVGDIGVITEFTQYGNARVDVPNRPAKANVSATRRLKHTGLKGELK